MDFSILELNYNSVETIPGFETHAAFAVNSSSVFKDDADIVPTIFDNALLYPVKWLQSDDVRLARALRERRNSCNLPVLQRRGLVRFVAALVQNQQLNGIT